MADTYMKIAVCIKQVVTRAWQLRVNEAGIWIRDTDASFELNEPDAYALEEALRLKEKHGGEVVVCSAGPARASQVLREALAGPIARFTSSRTGWRPLTRPSSPIRSRPPSGTSSSTSS
jgi:electron transfer flavoprotein